MLGIVALSLFRDGKRTMAPAADVTLRAGDQLLLAGRLRDRAALHTTLTEEPVGLVRRPNQPVGGSDDEEL